VIFHESKEAPHGRLHGHHHNQQYPKHSLRSRGWL